MMERRRYPPTSPRAGHARNGSFPRGRGRPNLPPRHRPATLSIKQAPPITTSNPFGFNVAPPEPKPLPPEHPLMKELAELKATMEQREKYWAGLAVNIPDEMKIPGSYDHARWIEEKKMAEEAKERLLKMIAAAELGFQVVERPVVLEKKDEARLRRENSKRKQRAMEHDRVYDPDRRNSIGDYNVKNWVRGIQPHQESDLRPHTEDVMPWPAGYDLEASFEEAEAERYAIRLSCANQYEELEEAEDEQEAQAQTPAAVAQQPKSAGASTPKSPGTMMNDLKLHQSPATALAEPEGVETGEGLSADTVSQPAADGGIQAIEETTSENPKPSPDPSSLPMSISPIEERHDVVMAEVDGPDKEKDAVAALEAMLWEDLNSSPEPGIVLEEDHVEPSAITPALNKQMTLAAPAEPALVVSGETASAAPRASPVPTFSSFPTGHRASSASAASQIPKFASFPGRSTTPAAVPAPASDKPTLTPIFPTPIPISPIFTAPMASTAPTLPLVPPHPNLIGGTTPKASTVHEIPVLSTAPKAPTVPALPMESKDALSKSAKGTAVNPKSAISVIALARARLVARQREVAAKSAEAAPVVQSIEVEPTVRAQPKGADFRAGGKAPRKESRPRVSSDEFMDIDKFDQPVEILEMQDQSDSDSEGGALINSASMMKHERNSNGARKGASVAPAREKKNKPTSMPIASRHSAVAKSNDGGRTNAATPLPHLKSSRAADEKPSPHQAGRVLRIGNLSSEANEEDIAGLFEGFQIESVVLPRDSDTGMTPGHAYVVFRSVAESESALDGVTEETTIEGRRVVVRRGMIPSPYMKQSKPWKPPMQESEDNSPRAPRTRIAPKVSKSSWAPKAQNTPKASNVLDAMKPPPRPAIQQAQPPPVPPSQELPQEVAAAPMILVPFLKPKYDTELVEAVDTMMLHPQYSLSTVAKAERKKHLDYVREQLQKIRKYRAKRADGQELSAAQIKKVNRTEDYERYEKELQESLKPNWRK